MRRAKGKSKSATEGGDWSHRLSQLCNCDLMRRQRATETELAPRYLSSGSTLIPQARSESARCSSSTWPRPVARMDLTDP